ncbi:hypothetical protein J4230_00915 [Candidatus Woesearchaeota archaeon]|nr:hypothetical protein [Candidatus Woesearchaeota archaeon]
MKVLVIEDGATDIVEVYSGLLRSYDLHVSFVEPITEANQDVVFNGAVEYLSLKGFDKDKIYRGFSGCREIISSVDVFFVDSLEGKVNDVVEMNEIPKSKVYVVTSDENIRMEYERSGYKTLIKKLSYILVTMRRLERK